MSLDTLLSRSSRAAASTAVTLFLAVPLLPAADESNVVIPLDVLSVSATRSPQDVRTLPQSVDLIDLPALADTQIVDLHTALAATPGVIVATSGAAGATSSVFMRGASSHQITFLVDGVRMNDRSASYTNFLGGADLAGLDRFEVLRGPQSTLYGSSAMGGVISLETARGTAANAGGVVSAQAGSFGTWGASIAGRGGIGETGFSGSISRFATDNDRPGNRFDVLSATGRLEGRPMDHVLIGTTMRWQESTYEEPGSRVFPYPGAMNFENLLWTGYAEWSEGDSLRSRLTVGRHHRDYVYADDFSTTETSNRRTILDWQNTLNATTALEVVGGLNYESSRTSINDLRSGDDLLAGYLSTTWRTRPNIIVHAGVRHDEFDSVGGATTGRAGVAWLLHDGRTKLRTTYGTGFTAPGSDDRYGVALWGQLGNPDIRPEKARGWDVGVDHDFNGGAVGVSATWFHNRYRDLFEYEIVDSNTFAGMIVNRAAGSTQGAELAVRWRPNSTIDTTLAYTWLDAKNDITATRLIRRPRHTLNLDSHWRATSTLMVGGGVRFVGDRLDNTDAGTAKIEDYTTVRLYVSYAVGPEVRVNLRLENALNAIYDEVFGYAALPRAFYGSVEWRF